MSTVLWYVHDVGSGHLRRAAAVLAHVDVPVVVAGGPRVDLGVVGAMAAVVATVTLPSDVPPRAAVTVGPWHWSPASDEVRARGLALADVVREHGCTTAVVDVSVEVAVLCRLLGMRVISLRQSGRRTDEAHRIGFASADVVWVPQHPALEPIEHELPERTRWTGAFSRFDNCRPQRRTSADRHAVIVVGTGGHRLDASAWRHGGCAPDGWQITLAGLDERWTAGRVRSLGFVDDVGTLLSSADVAITAAGWASVADAVACGARLAVVAEPRPFDEQCVRAGALAGAGLAVALHGWPTVERLGDVLDTAMGLDPTAWDEYYDGLGAERAAEMVSEVHR